MVLRNSFFERCCEGAEACADSNGMMVSERIRMPVRWRKKRLIFRGPEFVDFFGKLIFQCRGVAVFAQDFFDISQSCIQFFYRLIENGGKRFHFIVFPETDADRKVFCAQLFKTLSKTEKRAGNFVRQINGAYRNKREKWEEERDKSPVRLFQDFIDHLPLSFAELFSVFEKCQTRAVTILGCGLVESGRIIILDSGG